MSLRDLLIRVLSFGRRDAIDAELAEEIAEHLRCAEDANRAAGMSARDARDAARRAFGNPTLARESSRASWGFAALDTWLGDIRFGARVLRKYWTSTLVAVLALGVGIGAATAAVSSLDAVYHRRYAYRDPSRIVMLWAWSVRDRGLSEANVSPAEMRLWSQTTNASASTAKISGFGFERSLNIVVGDGPSRVRSASIPSDFFGVLGVRPLLGRGFTRDDERDDAGNVAIVSFGFWQRALGGLASAIDRTVVIDRTPYRIVGVMPRDFEMPTSGDVPVLLPIHESHWSDRVSRTMTVVGRLAPHTTAASLAAQLDPVSARFNDASPPDRGQWTVNVEPLAHFGTWVADMLRPFVALAWMVLLIACANVAILLLARIPAREQELAIRLALGAGARRLLCQLCVESALLVSGGVVIGLAVAGAASRLLVRTVSAANYEPHPTLSSPVVILAIAIAAGSCLLFGLMPAVGALRRLGAQPIGLIGGRRTSGTAGVARLRSALVAAEVALSVVLLTGGVMMVESMMRMRDLSLGFDGDGLVTARVTLDTSRYRNTASRRVFVADLVARLGAHSELHGVTAGTMIPLVSGGWTKNYITRSSNDRDTSDTYTIAVTPGYFAALEMPIVQGTSFTDARTDAGVIVNEHLARRLWPDRSAVGQRLRVLDPVLDQGFTARQGERTVVGVVRDAPLALGSRMAKTLSVLYLPYHESPARSTYFAVHAPTVDAGAAAIRAEVAALDAELPVFDVASIDQLADTWLASLRLSESIGELLAAIGLALTVVGVYSVVAVLVSQRTHEIGIRLAIGARDRDVVRLVLRRALVAACIGGVCGIGASIASQRLISELLYETSPAEPLAFVVATVVLGGVVLLAAYVPARRAAKLDPLTALRTE